VQTIHCKRVARQRMPAGNIARCQVSMRVNRIRTCIPRSCRVATAIVGRWSQTSGNMWSLAGTDTAIGVVCPIIMTTTRTGVPGSRLQNEPLQAGIRKGICLSFHQYLLIVNYVAMNIL
ncbi:MAG: hypothetical protein OXM61_11845, partial [Candidatus Poribacteria bacterium]|nr:hypothetical protein [Candidatus Poribacteria bacterium]